MVIITKVILAVEKIEQKYGCSFSIIMSMSLVLGQVSQVICVVKPGIFVSYYWSCSCNMLICPASYKRSHLGKKKQANRDSCYRGASYVLKQMTVSDLEVKHIL